MAPQKLCLGAVLGVVFVFGACTISQPPTGPVQTETKEVKLGDAKQVHVEVQIGAGELSIAAGAKNLLDAEFTYNVPDWKPQVDYTVSAGQGRLSIRQPEGTGGPGGNAHYNWDLRLKNGVPLTMDVKMGAGRANLTLGKLSLTGLDLDLGAGETTVDLTGDWKQDLMARIRGGVGRATIRLPRDVGVEVEAEGGIGAINAHDFKKEHGAYVNDAYGKSPVTLRVDVKGGVGEINLELAEAPPVV